ncbi:uncharacterized protein [Periplaneta americana]|uniref:uncharacterized protein n=1 Tax=Periplaneta americana TaxID=6978 RepID=UPI0037E7847E
MTTTDEKPATIVSNEELRCFVCDVAVTGRYYTLATCRTQSTKIRLIEKLGQLVGERYMVVISEDDIICRGCANLMNTLDRLETEMGSVRNVVLRFLEKKYALEEGELLNNKATNFCPPPQITSRNTSVVPGSRTRYNTNGESFMSRKRKAALSEIESEQENSLPGQNSKSQKTDPKSNVWMQCDKCKYTTHYNAFMIHHIRQHVKKKNPTCDYCGDEVASGGTCAKQCGMKKTSVGDHGKVVNQVKQPTHFKKYMTENGSTVIRCEGSDTAESETVEMIAAEINEFRQTGRSTESPDVVISAVQTNEGGPSKNCTTDVAMLPTIHEAVESGTTAIIIDQSQQDGSHMELSKADDVTIEVSDIPQHQEGNVEVQLNDVDGSTPTAICVMEMSEDSSAEQPTLLTVQKMEGEGNAVYVQVVEVGKGEEIENSGNITKQVLTVSEDGTVEMVEVMWDEMVSHDVGTEQDISFG